MIKYQREALVRNVGFNDAISASAESAAATSTQALSTQNIARYIPDSAATANRFGFIEIVIPGYTSTSWHKICRSNWSCQTSTTIVSSFIGSHTVLWKSTSAVTQVQLNGQSIANLDVGSVMWVYGRK